MKVQKVDDGAEPQAVDDIADGTADDQPDGGGQQRARGAPEPDEQYCDDDGRKQREDDALIAASLLNSPKLTPRLRTSTMSKKSAMCTNAPDPVKRPTIHSFES